MNTHLRQWAVIAALTSLVAAPLAAQQPPAGGGNPQPDNRALLQQRIGERLAQMVQQRLGLTDDQMKQLQATNRNYDERRRLLVQQERDIRMALRDEMFRGDSANQSRIGDMLDRAVKVQRQRLDLVESEQRDLSRFLTPLQRAKYFAIQDQMHRRMEQFREQRAPRGGALRREGGPGGGFMRRPDGARRPARPEPGPDGSPPPAPESGPGAVSSPL
jgi:Spy/CpxP family protein refolding chaperone